MISGWCGATGGGPGLFSKYALQKRRVLTFVLGGRAVAVGAAVTGRGADLFAKRCAICHGAGLEAGGTAPDLHKVGAPMAYESLIAVLNRAPIGQVSDTAH